MNTVELAAQDWSRALDEFSSIHEGWLISLELLDPELGAQPQINELPLVGVTAEKGPRGSTITIAAATKGGANITHIVQSPTHVRIERTDDGVDEALEIESDAGTTAILRFKTPAHPDTVDGIVRR